MLRKTTALLDVHSSDYQLLDHTSHHLTSSFFPSRTIWISLASKVSYFSKASAKFLCSFA